MLSYIATYYGNLILLLMCIYPLECMNHQNTCNGCPCKMLCNKLQTGSDLDCNQPCSICSNRTLTPACGDTDCITCVESICSKNASQICKRGKGLNIDQDCITCVYSICSKNASQICKRGRSPNIYQDCITCVDSICSKNASQICKRGKSPNIDQDCITCVDSICSKNASQICRRGRIPKIDQVCITCVQSICSNTSQLCNATEAFSTRYSETPHSTTLTEITTEFSYGNDGQNGTTDQPVGQHTTNEEVTEKNTATTPTPAGPLHSTSLIEIIFSKFTENEYKTTTAGKNTTPALVGKRGRRNEDEESSVKVVVGSVVSVFLLIGIAIIILYFIKKKTKNGSKSQSVSHEMTNGIYMANANKTLSMEISANNPGHIEPNSEHNALHNSTTEIHEYEFASYPGDNQEQLTPTVSTVALIDSPDYSTLKEDEESDVILKQSESQSTYMSLQHGASTTLNTGSTALQTEAKSDFSYASYLGESRMVNEEVSNDAREYYTLQREKSDVKERQNESQSTYMGLQHDDSNTTNSGPSATSSESESEYSYATYSMKCTSNNEEVPMELPVYYTLQKEQGSGGTDLTSNVREKPNNIDIPKQGGLQSEYMCLQQDDESIRSTTIVPPLAIHAKVEQESDVESEYSYATYQGNGQNLIKPIENADRSKGYAPKMDQDSAVNNTLNVRSLRNDEAYSELKLGMNDSNESFYDMLNHLTGTRVPDDVTDDYNKLILSPEYDEESEEYSHLNREFLNTDKSATDASYGKLNLAVRPAQGSI